MTGKEIEANSSSIKSTVLSLFETDNFYPSNYEPSISLLYAAELFSGQNSTMKPTDDYFMDLAVGLEVLQAGVNLHYIFNDEISRSILLGDKYYSLGLQKIFNRTSNEIVFKISQALGKIADGFSIKGLGEEKLRKISSLWECAIELAWYGTERGLEQSERKNLGVTMGSLYYLNMLDYKSILKNKLLSEAKDIVNDLGQSTFKSFIEERLASHEHIIVG